MLELHDRIEQICQGTGCQAGGREVPPPARMVNMFGGKFEFHLVPNIASGFVVLPVAAG